MTDLTDSPSIPLDTESSCFEAQVPLGTLILMHGVDASKLVRSAARKRFDHLVNHPGDILRLLPPCAVADSSLLHKHPLLVSARTPSGTPRSSSANLTQSLGIAIKDDARLSAARQENSGHYSYQRKHVPEDRRNHVVAPAADRPTRSMSALPMLDFGQLPDISIVSTAQICSARRKVDSIVAALSCVRPYLYVTGIDGIRDTSQLRAAGITHVLNLAGFTAGNFHEDSSITYLCMYPRDDLHEDISVLFNDVSYFIDSARASSGVVAIHCHMGVSRGCAMAAAYLMMDEGLSHEDALQSVRNARPVAEPNGAFVESLRFLERRIRNGHDRPVLYRVQCFRKDCDPDYLVAVPVYCCCSKGSSPTLHNPPASSITEVPNRDPGHQKEEGVLSVVKSGNSVHQHATGLESILDEHHGWILALPRRSAIHVLRGPKLLALAWHRTQQIAVQMGCQEERFEKMFPLASQLSVSVLNRTTGVFEKDQGQSCDRVHIWEEGFWIQGLELLCRALTVDGIQDHTMDGGYGSNVDSAARVRWACGKCGLPCQKWMLKP